MEGEKSSTTKLKVIIENFYLNLNLNHADTFWVRFFRSSDFSNFWSNFLSSLFKIKIEPHPQDQDFEGAFIKIKVLLSTSRSTPLFYSRSGNFLRSKFRLLGHFFWSNFLIFINWYFDQVTTPLKNWSLSKNLSKSSRKTKIK